MKKSLIITAALIVLTACEKKKETDPVAEETTVEAPADTITKENDTVTAAEAVKESDATETAEEPDEKKTTIKQGVAANTDYASFGDKITTDNVFSKERMLKEYKSMGAGDTVTIKFKSKIKDVCQKKGCWMAMQLPNQKEVFVKFKDYAFFVPLNAANQEAIVSGKAFVSETSVAQLGHYAKDGGKSEAEIAKITEPEIEYKFLADGVLISK